MTELQVRILSAAQAEIGRGEDDRDNAGPDIARYFRRPFKPSKSYGNWCAAFVAFVLETAGVSVRRSTGAKRICRNAAEVGRWIWRPVRFSRPVAVDTFGAGVLAPGDVIAWHRGRQGADWRAWWQDWRGHVEIVAAYDPRTDELVTIAGNVGRAPAMVRTRHYGPGAWRRRLFGVARPG